MSQEYAWPHAWRRDGEPAAEPPARSAAGGLGEIAPALVLGGFPQAFDFFVCAIIALAVLPRVYFPGFGLAGAIAAGLAVWLLAYGVAWLARPLTAALDRRVDSRVRLAISRLVFTAATITIGFLPVAREAAWAPALLVAGRVLQGLALAGLVHGPLLMQLSPAEERRERRRVWAISGAIGLAAAGVLTGILALALSGPDFLAWGWRYPFVIAIAVNIAGVVGDFYAESEAHARRGRAQLRLVVANGARVDAPRAG